MAYEPSYEGETSKSPRAVEFNPYVAEMASLGYEDTVRKLKPMMLRAERDVMVNVALIEAALNGLYRQFSPAYFSADYAGKTVVKTEIPRSFFHFDTDWRPPIRTSDFADNVEGLGWSLGYRYSPESMGFSAAFIDKPHFEFDYGDTELNGRAGIDVLHITTIPLAHPHSIEHEGAEPLIA